MDRMSALEAVAQAAGTLRSKAVKCGDGAIWSNEWDQLMRALRTLDALPTVSPSAGGDEGLVERVARAMADCDAYHVGDGDGFDDCSIESKEGLLEAARAALAAVRSTAGEGDAGEKVRNRVADAIAIARGSEYTEGPDGEIAEALLAGEATWMTRLMGWRAQKPTVPIYPRPDLPTTRSTEGEGVRATPFDTDIKCEHCGRVEKCSGTAHHHLCMSCDRYMAYTPPPLPAVRSTEGGEGAPLQLSEEVALLIVDALPLLRHCAEYSMKGTARGAFAAEIAEKLAAFLEGTFEARRGMHEAMAYARGRQDERRDVVAWLRDFPERLKAQRKAGAVEIHHWHTNGMFAAFDQSAPAIEAGAHLPADTAETAPPGSGMKEGA